MNVQLISPITMEYNVWHVMTTKDGMKKNVSVSTAQKRPLSSIMATALLAKKEHILITKQDYAILAPQI